MRVPSFPAERERAAASSGTKLVGLLLVALLCLGVAPSALAQRRRVASPLGSSSTEVGGRFDPQYGYVGGKWIEVRYGRPIKRGRDLFGPPDFFRILNDGAPVWRAGANVSTELVTELPLVFGDTTVAPGTYTLFIELRRERWTFIVSRWEAQQTYQQNNRDALYGAFHYRPDKDVVRVEMDLETLPHSFDQLSWELVDMTLEGGRLALIWDDRMASVPFRFGE